MDLKDLFKPLNEEHYQDHNSWQTTQLGFQIKANNLNNFPKYKFC